MPYTLSCQCGRQLAVSAAQAGSQVACSCGCQVSVPTLGKLARAAGEPLRTLSASEKVRVLVASGELPAEITCARCRMPTKEVLECSIECERPYVKKRSLLETFLMYTFAPLWLAIVAKRNYDEPEVFGRETVVKTPLRMCPDCQALFDRGARAPELRELLVAVPEYAELLEAFPRGSVAATIKRPTVG